MSMSETSKSAFGQQPAGGGAVGGGLHPVAFAFQRFLQHEAQGFFVLGD